MASPLLFNLLSLLFLGSGIAIVVCVWDQFLTVPFWGNFPAGWVVLKAEVVIALVGWLQWKRRESELNQTNRRADRQRERAEVTAEASTDKVKALEAKVETLEKALQKALQSPSKS